MIEIVFLFKNKILSSIVLSNEAEDLLMSFHLYVNVPAKFRVNDKKKKFDFVDERQPLPIND